MGKQNHFEHSIKIPLIIKGPRLPKNHLVESKVYLYDIFPTLCEYLGFEIPNSVGGKSFYKCFTENTEHRKTMYYSYGSTIRSVRSGAFKLSEYIGEKGKRSTLLFNVIEDPLELKNLYSETSSKSLEMRQELLKMREEVGDTTRPESMAFWGRF